MLSDIEAMLPINEIAETARRVCCKGLGQNLGAGNDSYVRRVDGLVYKVYTGEGLVFMTGGRIHERVTQYRDITNNGAKLSVRDDWSIELPSLGKSAISLRINPFPAIVSCSDCKSIIGVASYIEGPTLLQEAERFEGFDLYGALSVKDIWIGEQLHARGISLRPENIKILGTENDVSLMITDLAANIGLFGTEVQPGNKRDPLGSILKPITGSRS